MLVNRQQTKEQMLSTADVQVHGLTQDEDLPIMRSALAQVLALSCTGIFDTQVKIWTGVVQLI